MIFLFLSPKFSQATRLLWRKLLKDGVSESSLLQLRTTINLGLVSIKYCIKIHIEHTELFLENKYLIIGSEWFLSFFINILDPLWRLAGCLAIRTQKFKRDVVTHIQREECYDESFRDFSAIIRTDQRTLWPTDINRSHIHWVHIGRE